MGDKMDTDLLYALSGIVICGLVYLTIREGKSGFLILSVLFVIALILILTFRFLGTVLVF
jgi:hypothetical protein